MALDPRLEECRTAMLAILEKHDTQRAQREVLIAMITICLVVLKKKHGSKLVGKFLAKVSKDYAKEMKE